MGSLTASSSMETGSIAIKPLSGSYSRTNINSVTITLETDYTEVWEQLLSGTSTADTIVSVNQTQSEIVITSTAVKQNHFPSGNVSADALYAGLATFCTKSEPVTFTSVDISENYPCILDIDIAAVTKGSSTITATVKNTTAPFDIHADLSVLMNDTEMYDIFPDTSSPDSIGATSWSLPNQNTLEWTNISHPEYAGGEVIAVTFWIINTENNMQFFTTRMFHRQNPTTWY